MSNGPEDSTAAAGWDVELDADTADRAEELLRGLATDAELEMAVVVERSGGMIAGVATRQDVDVSTVGALVAGASGAMGALANELGESRVRESLHQGSGDTIYLREIGERFVLLGVAPSDLPSGLIREKGAQVAEKLTDLLGEPAAAAAGAEPEDERPDPGRSAEVAREGSPFQASETGPVTPEKRDAEESFPAEGKVHTRISVEDDHSVSMPSLNPAVQPPPDSDAAADPPPEKEKPGDPTYVFEIG